MKQRQILWAIVFGSMLAITGCGDDEGGSGGSGTGGSGTGGSGTGGSGTGGSGTGGSNGGPSSSTCEAICSSTCVLMGVDPGTGFDECAMQCGFVFTDDCGPEADAFLACMAANDCDPEASACQNEGVAWGTCLSGINFP
ncbi:MAG: hypothetical protein JRG67_02325 [Deltaproteobacteria bacterium]|nr:hypothetical protein [Deltaproteobacteria bacterium]MBW2209871.1 hypothetical protein [Deltaproteobacteria bacterium]MBW2550896.1 hypothetical protein [Deltaproteobacteria bacterium]MBW2684453.1 hypothetical protein [Deltaproteobacteria bacterium]